MLIWLAVSLQHELILVCSNTPYSSPDLFRCETESDEPCAWKYWTTNKDLSWKKGNGIFRKETFRSEFGLIRRPCMPSSDILQLLKLS